MLEVLTREAVRFCGRAVWLFPAPPAPPAPLAQMRTALIRDFHQWFAKKALAGPYGSYDKMS